ncbi:ATP-binding protein [Frankia sp. Cppng1_Ct_nod]|uniref:ATP-binding protein n=1 Tax=Frankia sp. Cppng1_Ct_nod TaxID=2897162 RepID=UPI001041BBCE|nr:ATP-binding protein [Frankia sp. Cppng1_Ct_nod]
MEIRFSLSLPREEISIPVVRRMCAQSLKVLGVHQDCIDDVGLALTEACANVLQHARADDWYQVFADVDSQAAVIDVVDNGGGFDLLDTDTVIMDVPAEETVCENGRGICVMRALMDDVRFDTVHEPTRGTRVHLEKLLLWDESAPANRLDRHATRCGSWTDGRPLSATAHR